MITNADCTVFYPIYNKQTRLDEWQYVHILGVFWENCKAASVSKRGLAEADLVTVYIPFTSDFEGRKYKRPVEFRKASNGAFTIASGCKIVKGIVDYAGAITKLSDEYDDVYTIMSVDTMDYGSSEMQHWQVGGK